MASYEYDLGIIGAEIRFGKPVFADDHVVELDGKMISAKNWIIATGSGPVAPPIEGLESVPFWTNETVFYALFLSTGRKPNIDELALERAGVAFAPRGIPADHRLRTNISHIYACGDVNGQFPSALFHPLKPFPIGFEERPSSANG